MQTSQQTDRHSYLQNDIHTGQVHIHENTYTQSHIIYKHRLTTLCFAGQGCASLGRQARLGQSVRIFQWVRQFLLKIVWPSSTVWLDLLQPSWYQHGQNHLKLISSGFWANIDHSSGLRSRFQLCQGQTWCSCYGSCTTAREVLPIPHVTAVYSYCLIL